MIDDAIIDDLRNLAHTIAPEIDQPLYVLTKPEAFDMPNVAAVAIQGPCVLLSDILKADGRWQGPGPCILFRNDDLPCEIVQGTFLHELAHLVPFRPTAEFESTPETRAANECEMAAWRANPGNEFPEVPAWLPDHGKQFHRAALHLWWRAAFEGVVVPLDSLNICDSYGLSPTYSYWSAFGNEGSLMRGKTFAEIVDIEPPAAFLAWWRHDLRTWMNSNPEAVTKTMEAA